MHSSLGVLIRGAYDKFPDFFRVGTFIDSTVTVHKYLSQDGSSFYARVTSGQSGI